MKIDSDTFEDWLSHPLTEALMACCLRWAADEKERWLAASWDGGISDPTTLARLRERAMTLEQIASVTREQIEETLP